MPEKNSFSRCLCHMTPEEKKEYNKAYYQRNKERFWNVGKGRTKYVTEGVGGVKRRGEGLGTGQVGPVSNKRRSVDSSGALDSWANLVEQTGTPLQSYAYNQSVGIPTAPDPPPMTYDDLEIYLSSTILDNAVNNTANAISASAKGAKSVGKKIANQIANDWKTGAKAISSLFKKKKRR